ncbi:type II secretion system protein N [Dyella sp.]|uniref:type II secretion system protein N n=1 Tax=Dyella sp. TaxID=1869338 RepID=UPI002ED6A3DB
MKLWLRLTGVLVVLLLVLAGVIAFLPARWAQSAIETRLHGLRLAGVGGSVWNGHADSVIDSQGVALGRVDWQLSRRLLLGHLEATIDFDGPKIGFKGHMERISDTAQHWSDVHVRFDLSQASADAATGMRPSGVLEADIGNALLQGQWPTQLNGTGRWREAAMITRQGSVALGTLRWEAQAQNGLIQGTVNDLGDQGPLKLSGVFAASALGWRYSLDATPRGSQPALRRWLASLGPVDAEGSLHLEYKGGLASMSHKEKP